MMQCLKYARRYKEKCNEQENPASIPPEFHPLLPLTMDPTEFVFAMSVHFFILLLHIHVSLTNMWFDMF